MNGNGQPAGQQGEMAREPRDSALAFTEGVRSGWIASDLQAWVADHLVETRRLALDPGQPLRVFEPGAGSVTLGEPASSSTRGSVRAGAPVTALLTAARERVLKTLSASVDSGQTSYIHAALYTGRVSRERGANGRSSWYVFLADDMPLSDQVLALFAADALMNPAEYETDLCVCDVCGAVSFQAHSGSRRGCAIHPFGSVEGGKPPSSRSGARLITDRT